MVKKMIKEDRHDIIVEFLDVICKFDVQISGNSSYTTVDCGNGKFFYVGKKTGYILYGDSRETAQNRNNQYSVEAMRRILDGE